ncbi:MAG: PQQ-dependent sugar dehydrogenase [Ignavibacteriales bacterium]|nr:PQQ-dependent sugar dehydrogenase [Ignavibacteriales bacterium]
MKRMLLSAAVTGTLIPSLLSAQYSWQMQFPSLPAFSNPVELVHAYDGTNRLFVVQQRGIIYVFENDPTVSSRKIFLNLSDRVSQSGGETGLLGLAFHPSYPDTPYFYVNYTGSGSGSLRSYIARYRVSPSDPDSALHDSEEVLLWVDQPYSNHNGGKIAFGPEGYLYIGLGDGGSGNDPGNRAQNRTTILGKILRINMDSADAGLSYSIPPTNPYYKNGTGFREEIYAYGLRNPWKFSFDELTRTLWAGDVGQDTREEIDTITNGGNYGWRLMEGNICTPGVNSSCSDTAGLLRPVFDYPNLNPPLEGSITGGYVYRGSVIPSLYGKYIYGDYVSGRTFALTYEGVASPVNAQLSDESYGISSFGVDPGGNIYLCSYGGGGRIYKLTGPQTGVVERSEFIPAAIELMQNYPNPFNPKTEIRYRIPEVSTVSLTVYDMLGRESLTLVDEIKEAGAYSVDFNASRLPSGVYYYRLQSGGTTITKKMTVMK